MAAYQLLLLVSNIDLHLLLFHKEAPMSPLLSLPPQTLHDPSNLIGWNLYNCYICYLQTQMSYLQLHHRILCDDKCRCYASAGTSASCTLFRKLPFIAWRFIPGSCLCHCALHRSLAVRSHRPTPPIWKNSLHGLFILDLQCEGMRLKVPSTRASDGGGTAVGASEEHAGLPLPWLLDTRLQKSGGLTSLS